MAVNSLRDNGKSAARLTISVLLKYERAASLRRATRSAAQMSRAAVKALRQNGQKGLP